jgi:serine/threonine-protein kinase
MANVADRHLLFGLLALQVGLIDQAQLVAAFQAWTRDKARPLTEHLVARGDLDAEQRAGVEAMVALHLKKHGGDVEKSLAAISAGRSAREGLAGLRDPDIEATLGRVGPAHSPTAPDGDDPDRTASLSLGSATADGQRFRILRPHARGGLGAVFVALDGELHREVALKQILEEHADDPFSRRRFLAEAEITGGLEHPGIVPVYGLGADACGRPFYAMRFVQGDSLKRAIESFHADEAPKNDPGRRSLELRRLLRRFIDVCNAIDYAHSRGVIHRDLKPANIIVGRHGETLVVDWGLAKSVGRADPSAGERTIAPSSSGSSETLPGSALGTPGYMSPEQARGALERLGPRSDVYGLGATLYCLLTGKPPFAGEDVGAILEAVREGRFPHPRQIDPRLDRALEAVCLKAMALRPEDRYASARALAEDVERWMADEPVSAWREPASRRLSRWLGRHRTEVAGASAAALAGVVGLIAVLAVQSAANARLSESLQRETEANAELKRSRAAVQARYDLAAEAVRTLHTVAAEDFLLKEDRFKGPRDRLLKSASDFYGELGALLGRETDVASRRALARSNFELAELTNQVGRKEAALAAHRSVLAARAALAAEPGAGIETRVDVGRSLAAVASLLYATGLAGEAEATYRRSEALLADLAGFDPSARAALADCRSRLGSLLDRTGRNAEALMVLRQARADQEALAAAPGASVEARRDLALTVNRVGVLLRVTGRLAESEAEFRQALAILQGPADEGHALTDLRDEQASGHVGLSLVLSKMGRPAEAEAECRAALAIQQEFADENPAVTQYRVRLAGTRSLLVDLLSEMGRSSEAEAEYRTALAAWRKLADEDPAVPSFRRGVGQNHANLGLLLFQMGRPSEAEAECRTALAILQELSDHYPADIPFRRQLAFALDTLGDVVRSRGRAAEAGGLYDREIALREPLIRANPTDLEHRYWLVHAIRRRGLARRDLNDAAGAAADTRRALGLCDGLPPRAGRDLFETACCHAGLAGLAGRAGSGVSTAEGEAEADRAMEWLGRAVAMGYRNVNEIRIESALDPLRSREDFRRMMGDLEFPTDPFARGD